MSITYLDENLLLSKDKYYVTDKDFLFNIKYYIRKKSAFERYNAYIEERMHDVYNSELNDMLDYYINIFKENYSRILYKSVNNISIEECIKEEGNIKDYIQYIRKCIRNL